ncbi:MAG TPA: peptide-methionine (S)-S-oxide reductase MsrA [Opitutaceae bacterium]|nr:peptide-methionine (S)-S-oxide reductase MsrA [Opitutaceae bacterium]
MIPLSSSLVAAEKGSSAGSEFAYVGGGCFWCTEAAYELLPGVKAAVSGYAGGKTRNPTYEEVCTGTTGHAELIRIEYDPSVITYRQIIDFFWEVHDPTTLNRQGADRGTQYRSIIFTTDEKQRSEAQASLAAAQPAWGGKIVTEIVPLEKFYVAEEYHQDYFRKNPSAGYCQVVIKPKVEKLKKSPQVTGKK